MVIFRLLPHPSVLVFDVDNTLYRNNAFTEHQNESQIRKLCQQRGLSHQQGLDALSEAKKRLDQTRGSRGQWSLGNRFLELGVSFQEVIDWRNEGIKPEEFLVLDQKLQEVLGVLQKRYRLCALTNNPAGIASRTLACLGIGGFFEKVWGLDDMGESKPTERALNLVLSHFDLKPEAFVSIGDRYDVDLSLPLQRGMSGLLVGNMEDVYRLPEFLP